MLRSLQYIGCGLLIAYANTAISQETYNSMDLPQTLRRDVSYVEPQTFHPAADGTELVLEVKEAINTFNGIRLRHRSYNGGLAGPIIRVRPGTNLRIRLENHLAPEPPTPHENINLPHGFNTTNLHTHGLHVSPESPADNVYREVAPGSSYDFVFPIEDDHPAGTFWYHAHKHGSTAFQLASGMAGALIVEGGLDDVPEIRAAAEKVMVFQQFIYRETPGDPAHVNPDDIYPTASSGQIAINGQVTPTIVMRPGEVQRWRMIHGGVSDPINLKFADIPLHEIAVDGLALGTRVERPAVELHPGYRLDVLIKAPNQMGAYLLKSSVKDKHRTSRERLVLETSVLKLVVAGAPHEMPLPEPESLRKYAPFTDDDVPNDDDLKNDRELRFELGDTTFLINEEPFNPNEIKHSIVEGSAERWKIVGKVGGHPFHIHVNPFAVPVPQGDPNPNKWVWRDTLFVPHEENVSIRSWFKKHTGKTVLHCHILDHEDQGMMQAIEIIPGGAQQTAVEQPTAPSWRLTDVSGKEFASEELASQQTLLIFHRGFACEHCAEQIRLLAERRTDLKKAELRVVTVCPQLPNESELSSLVERWQIDFPLLSDTTLDTFRKFECLARDGEPLHGVFLLTVDGRIAWKSIGEQPETDIDRLLDIAKRELRN